MQQPNTNKLLNLEGCSTKLRKEANTEIQHSTTRHNTDVQGTASLITLTILTIHLTWFLLPLVTDTICWKL